MAAGRFIIPRRAATAIFSATLALGQAKRIPLDHPAIEYARRPATDVVSELNRRIQDGAVQPGFEEPLGYLRSVLDALHVPIESQLAVFSKTSVQGLRISPGSPRALYFNDSVVVGYVRGGFLELAAQDPQLGMIFFTADQRPWVHMDRAARHAAKPEALFQRRNDCLNCHVANSTGGVPGTLIHSVFPAPDGIPVPGLAVIDTDQRTLFENLWGGWYVTGGAGKSGGGWARHMGNAVVTDREKPASMVTGDTVYLESLRGKFDTGAWLSPYSDIVALMVFEHQMHLMNLLTQAGWQTRLALYPQGTGKLTAEVDGAVSELVDYMLFVDEAPLEGKVRGTSGFMAEFSARGPFDRKGRSLRQLDLERRLMRYPCSYMIYSRTFDSLPAEAKAAVYRRLWRILSGELAGAKYARLTEADRRAVVEILRGTKPDLPAYFGSGVR